MPSLSDHFPGRRRLAGAAAALALLLAGCSTDPIESSTTATSASVDEILRPGPQTATLAEPYVTPESTPTPDLPVTVTDFGGTEVTVTDASRIIALDRYGTLAQTVLALGLGGSIVGRDVPTDDPTVADVPVVTDSGHRLTPEAILDLDPTVLLVDSSIGPPEAIDRVREAGVPVVTFAPGRSVDTVTTQIEAVGAALGVPDAASDLAGRVGDEIAAARATIPAGTEDVTATFVYLRGAALQLMAGPGSGADDLIAALGATDAATVAGQTQPFLAITTEAMIAADPDVILVMAAGAESVGGLDAVAQLPGIAQTSAGSNDRIIAMDDSYILGFGPRTGRVLSALADAMYR